MPKPVSIPRGGISFSTQFQAGWKPDTQAAVFKVCKYIQSYRITTVIPDGLQARRSGGIPLATIAKIGALDKCISSFMGVFINVL